MSYLISSLTHLLLPLALLDIHCIITWLWLRVFFKFCGFFKNKKFTFFGVLEYFSSAFYVLSFCFFFWLSCAKNQINYYSRSDHWFTCTGVISLVVPETPEKCVRNTSSCNSLWKVDYLYCNKITFLHFHTFQYFGVFIRCINV